MERPYVGWEEVVISNERGKRQVNYYVRRSDGKGLDLAVVGKERTIRHMSYSFVLYKKGDAEPPIVVAPPPNGRLKSRREVIDWLSFVVSDSSSPGPSQQVARLLEEDAFDACLPSSKDSYVRNLAPKCKEFMWVGHATTGRKRRKHYQSFCRNGITISVHDFVYVLAEENKRLVAYLEDLYEDSRSNKMVVVRWFHKVDEVGIVLPPNFNDREIFFSLCLQDLSVECIDGLAAVLGPQHFEKYLNEATHTLWQPFLCHRQFDNDVITDFDITQVQGYWTQEILRYMYTASSFKPMEHNLFIDTMADVPVNADDDDVEDGVMRRPLKKKRHSRSKSKELPQESNDHKGLRSTDEDLSKLCNGLVSESGTENCGVKKSNFAIPLSMKEMAIDTPKKHLAKDCPVEVLSQDSGIKGCWFRAVVIKRSKEKVKVRYLDLKDAEDDTKHVEEWIWANRIAVPDGLGIRLHGRVTVRPTPSSCNGISAEYMDAGSPVDAWWHDGWWEGIVVRVDSDNKFHVYFPGEKKMSIFGCDNLRCSQDWLCDRWCSVKCRPDLASLFLSGNETVQDGVKSLDVEGIHSKPLASSKTLDGEGIHSIPLASSKRQYVRNHSVVYVSPKEQLNSPCLELNNDTTKGSNSLPNLAKDNLLAQLRWNSSKKRRRCRGRSQRRGSSCLKQQSDGSGSSSSSREDVEFSPDSHLPNSSKFDSKGFKYQQDSLHDVSIPLIAGLVLSR